MVEIDLASAGTGLRIIGGLAALAGGPLLWIYGRRVGLEAARGRREAIKAETITDLESQVRVRGLTIEDRDRELEVCQRRRAEAEARLAEIEVRERFESERIG